MKKITKSLRGVLTLNFILAVSLPILIISVITVNLLSRSLSEQIITNNLLVTRDLQADTEDFLANADAVMREVVTVTGNGQLDSDQTQRYLEAIVQNHTYFDMVYIVDDNGQSLFSAPHHPNFATLDMSGQPFFHRTKETGQPYWSATFISQYTGHPTLTVTHPINGGMVVGYLNLSKLNELAARDSNKSGGWSAIVDTDGTFIGHSDQFEVYRRTNIRDAEYVRAALAGQTGVFRTTLGHDEYLINVAVAQPTGWVVVAAQRTAVAFSPVQDTRNIFIIGSVLALCLAIVAAIKNLGKILKPLNQLTLKTHQVSSGNYNLSMEPYDYAEFNTLSDNFRAMVEAVRLREVELRRKQAELAGYMRTLERSNRELNQFAYVVSHDLKAPLRAIANLTQWLEEDLGSRLDSDAQHKMELLRGRVRRMENLIEGILEYSRVGRIKTVTAPVDVSELIAEVIEDLAPPDDFHIVVGPGMPVITTERIRLKQVFANLIDNAIRYHDRPDGQVVITVTELDNCFKFVVADNGPGISPEFHHKIFEMFQTLKPRDTLESTGVGLALVKKIVESQSGSVQVISAEGQGAQFIFTWPKVIKED